MKVATITAERLRELLSYDEETGVFCWLAKPNRRIRVGDQAGVRFRGRIQIRIDGTSYRAHRLAWLYVYGTLPSQVIDHINGNACDNCIANLRDVSVAMNRQNIRKPMKHSKIGVLGVRKNVHGDKFSARVGNIHIGSFETPESAHEAYVIAKRQMHEGCTL